MIHVGISLAFLFRENESNVRVHREPRESLTEFLHEIRVVPVIVGLNLRLPHVHAIDSEVNVGLAITKAHGLANLSESLVESLKRLIGTNVLAVSLMKGNEKCYLVHGLVVAGLRKLSSQKSLLTEVSNH